MPTCRPPYEPAEQGARPAREVLGELAELGQDGDEIDAQARARLEDELLRAFAASPEAKALGGVQWSDLVLDYAATYFGATVAALGPDELRLGAALSNPRNFGMAKSLVMAGPAAGFDMETQEGVEARLRAVQAAPLPASVGLPPLGGPSWSLDGPSRAYAG